MDQGIDLWYINLREILPWPAGGEGGSLFSLVKIKAREKSLFFKNGNFI